MEEQQKEPQKLIHKIKDFYEKKYKPLFIITIAMLLIAMFLIGYKYSTEGDFINRDVSLKGGISFTIPIEKDVDHLALRDFLKSKYPNNDVFVKSFRQSAESFGLIVDIDLKESNEAVIREVIGHVSSFIGSEIKQGQYSYEFIDSSLGESFFRQTFIALGIAFLFMGIVVFFYFRTLVPSIAVITAAFSDIIVTLAIVNLLGIRVGTAGLSAFLMLIGYSVNTDILLTTRVLKRKETTENERIYSSIKTGFMTAGTTMAAVTVGLLVTDSEVIRQIMIIIFIGLIVDMFNTWIQNVGLLRWYLEKKNEPKA
ncbi:MAG TPA: hypothetical protein VJI46_02055 [Candidatus Nanoarchaeia archaeon]|nr:hypothetical protein [Candidatus Nanoarchaeia archaeon]